MKSTTFALAAALCAALTSAKPLDKRALVTTIEWSTITVTVTGSPPAETAVTSAVFAADATPTTGSPSWSSWTPDDSDSSSNSDGWFGGWRGGWGSGGGDSATTTAFVETEGPVPTSTATSTFEFSFTFTSESESASTSTPEAESSPASSDSGSSGSTTTSSTASSTSVSSDYQQGILDSHNIHRENASVPSLTWSDNMASIASQIAASCTYAHDTSAGGGGYGQNIGAGAPPSGVPAMITDEMYNDEINWYPGYGVEPDMTNFEHWGHYSQIVWKSTTSVGCATQYCPNGLANTGGGVSPYFTVCNYSPPGNFGGEYAANVLQPGDMATVTL